MKTTLLTLVFIGIILAIVILLASSVIYIYTNKKQINADWPDYKCKPYVFPFAGIFVGPSTTNPMDNFRDCSWLIFKSFFDVLIAPFIEILQKIVDILTNYQQDIQNVRNMFNYMRNSMSDIATDIYNKLYDAYYRIAYMYRAFTKVFYQIFETYVSAINTMLFGFFTLGSVWNGPIGGVTRFFCFDKNTNIEMADNTYRPISQLQIGQVTKYGGKILGIYYTMVPFDDMYMIKDRVILSGSHKILNEGSWIMAREHPDALYVPDYPRHNSCLYCLTTENNIITTDVKHVIFADWEQSNYLQKQIYYASYYYLNNPNLSYKVIPVPDQLCRPIPQIQWYHSLFEESALVLMADDTVRPINQLRVGDIVRYGGKVTTVIRHVCEPDHIYKYRDVITTSASIFFDEKKNKWRSIMENNGLFSFMGRPTKVDSHCSRIMYSLLTENETFMINDLLWRDYEIFSGIAPLVEKYLDKTTSFDTYQEIPL